LKKILIIIHDTILFTTFKIWLHNNKNKNSDVILISHSLEAREVLEKNEIDMVVMDLEVEKFDGFDLLLFCIKNYSKTHLVILSDPIHHNHSLFSSFDCLKKSSSLGQLKSLLKNIRKKELGFKKVKDIVIEDFFLLIQIKQKTCLIEIKSEHKKGFIYFNQGELFDTLYGDNKGELAFLNILNEKCAQLSFRKVPTRSFSRHIMTPLFDLIKTHRLQCDSLSAVDESVKENKPIILTDKLNSSFDNKEANDDELLITEGLVELTEDEELAIIKTKDSSKLINEKQPTIQPKKTAQTSSAARKIKILDRTNKKREDEGVDLALNNKEEVVFKKSKLTGKEKMALQDCLTPLQDVDGYLAAAIFDMSGEVLVQHNNSKHNISLIGANSISMINASVKAMIGAGLGKCNFIQVNSERGIFCAVWAVEDHSVVSILLEPNANIGMAKLLLAKVGEAGGSQLS